MIATEKFLLLAADSTHLVIRGEKILKEKGIESRIIPLPSQIKASCGLSIRSSEENLLKIREIFQQEKILMDFYLIEKIGLKKSFVKLENN